MKIQIPILILAFFLPFSGHAKLKVLTTTNNLKNLVEMVAGNKVSVVSLCKGTQDPHYIEAKPSYMLKASKADLLVSIGLDLEVGWLPLILRGSRNPKLRDGGKGSFIAGNFIETLEKPTAAISRADGDVHPEGNPHFLLDPINAIKIAEKLKEKLKKLDPDNSSEYEINFKKFSSDLTSKVMQWKKRVKVGTKVITYHKTLTYFYHRFGIENISLLEPKPGVPPSARHILGVMKKAKSEGVKLAIVENYFDPTVANRVAKGVDGLRVTIVPVSVNGEKEVLSLFDLYERLVSSVEEK
ncbi:MAG: zinc ABC transporter solute-binding protein [Bdellovibrionales bacterium]|jgi:zinc/manganese transport system substrate-binding protein|nr:zinc ABC transporter solute-binding protein [Bdellovibrionales bacterium]